MSLTAPPDRPHLVDPTKPLGIGNITQNLITATLREGWGLQLQRAADQPWRLRLFSLSAAPHAPAIQTPDSGLLLWPLAAVGEANADIEEGHWRICIPVHEMSDLGNDTQAVGMFSLEGRQDSGQVKLAVTLDAQRSQQNPYLRLGVELGLQHIDTSALRTYRSGQQTVFASTHMTVGVHVEAGRDITRPPTLYRSATGPALLLGDAAPVPAAVMPNHYLTRLSARAETGQQHRHTIRYAFRLWLTAGSELVALSSTHPVDHWGTWTRADQLPPHQAVWDWTDVIDELPRLRRQLEAFPRQIRNGQDCGPAPYPHHAFSDMSQWFYQPQILWPFIVQATDKTRSDLVTELVNILDAYNTTPNSFQPVNTVINGSDLHAASHTGSTFHWGWAFLTLAHIWRTTGDHRIADRITQLLEASLPSLPWSQVPRVVHTDLTFNQQARWGANGAWAIGLLAAYEHTQDTRFLDRATGLVDGANSKICDWQRLGSIEDWESFKPDGIAALALANAQLWRHRPEHEHYRHFAARWSVLAFTWANTSDLDGNFLNAYPAVGPAVSNIGWQRAGGAPDSDARCEATLEQMSVLTSLITALPTLDNNTVFHLLHYLNVCRHTMLSFCLRGAGDVNHPDIDLLALELHDNNTDILTPDRQPLVTSYMSGHPGVLAHVFTGAACTDQRVLSLDLRAVGETGVVLFNPTNAAITCQLRGVPQRISATLQPDEWVHVPG